MLKRLRLKFIALNMVVAFLVLTCSFGAICYLDYCQSLQDVYDELTREVQQARNPTLGILNRGNGIGDSSGTQLDQKDSGPATPRIGGHPDDVATVPMAVYYIDEDYEAVASPFSTAILNDEVLLQALEELEARNPDIQDGSRAQGSLADLGLLYVVDRAPFGFMAAFADASSVASWESLALLLTAVGAVVMLVFLIISIFFSRWALKPVEQAWEQQQRFIADASHELKTPLTVILANNSILSSHPESTVAEQSQWIESTQIEAVRMQDLLNAMLALARPREIADPKTLQTVDLSDLAATEALQFESVAFEAALQLESTVEPGLTVKGHQADLGRLMAILLDNACKHGRPDSVVAATLSRRGKEAVYRVCNQGQPIPPQDLPHVFDRFYQVDSARSQGGFGLGLAIAQEIARNHGGSIQVRSSAAEGTVFTVCLPLARG